MKRPEKKPAERKQGGLGFLPALALFALGAWVLRSLIVAPFSIPTGSMLPTMRIGDYLFVHKWPYGYSRFSFPGQIPSFEGRVFARLPQRGDIVVFRPPAAEGSDWVKRVIGLPGDRISVRRGAVYLDGKPLARVPAPPVALPISPNSPCRTVDGARPEIKQSPDGGLACIYQAYRETLPGGPSYITIDQVEVARADDFAETAVPQGHLFLMGDNRDDSLDSRYSPYEGGIGLVPLDHVVGRASARYWSTDGSAEWIKPWTWFTAVRAGRVGGSQGE